MKAGEIGDFYEEAIEVRNLDITTIDLIFDAEGIRPEVASIQRCKDAIMKYQYLPDDDWWLWQTDYDRIAEAIKARLLKRSPKSPKS